MDRAALASALIERMARGVAIFHAPSPDGVALVAAYGAGSRLDATARAGLGLREYCPAAIARGRHVVYSEVACSGVERAVELGDYPELSDAPVRGRLLPLPGQHVAAVLDGDGAREPAEDETRKLNAFLDSIIDNIPAMVFVKDAEHLRYELFNRTGEMMSGFTREFLRGKDDRQIFPKAQADFFQAKDREVLRDGRMLDIPEEPIDTALGPRWLHTKKIPILKPDGTPGHLLGISLDITERKLAVEALKRAHEELEARVQERTRELLESNARLQREIDERQRTQGALALAEEQLRHAQKMEAVGRLAGGIAHDFNNLLSVILSYINILTAGLGAGEDALAQGLAQIKKASERAADLTRQLLAFSRQQVLAPRVVDLNALIDGMSGMLRRVIGEDLELEIHKAPDLGHTTADPGQFEQVIMNLVVNALDAMPNGGKLTIRTGNVELDAAYAERHVGVAAGPYVMLAVTDTGVGMDQATLRRVFEPFFTTKEQGKGTGLGLSTVFGIVQQSGGHISVQSQPHRGATFRIYFARTEAPLAAVPARQGGSSAPGGSETLLLVEDEEQVRSVARDILISYGYRVLDAATPAAALELSAQYTGDIDLLVTDVVMPQMNGLLLAERLVRARPSLAVLFMSGYTDSAFDSARTLPPGAAFLQKPLTPLTLASWVRQTLDARTKKTEPG